ncbi:alpha/beta fold hydrolase [Microbacterium timonense]|uniref:alpha/beta fold hydrolase n=1 Tax=Microbacterium timonense TaxID=2086576 RepID=UPI000D103CD0|nr:alpha/beta hydrolase [Microbacterium timonense]
MVNLPEHVSLPGCVVRYADNGGSAQPSVLFLHGAGADHVMFETQRRALAEAGFRTVVVDLRAHGASRPNTTPLSADLFVQDIEALIAHSGLSRPALVGHSLGGNLAQRLVQRAPDRYSALAVLDATWNTGPLSTWERWALTIAAPVLRLIPRSRLPRVMADASAVTAPARADLVRAFSALSKEEFLAVWRATTQFVAPDPSYRTPVPLLLVRGEKDRTGNIARAMPRWATAEKVTEIVVPGAGHVITQDAPDAVAQVLRDFLTRVVDRAE